MEYTTFCPYRVCPIGAHVDHQHGLITGFALDKGVELNYDVTTDGSYRVESVNFDGVIEFNQEDEPARNYNWGDFLIGAVKILKEEYPLKNGFVGKMSGSLNAGGISSSAAVILAYLITIAKVNDIKLTRPQLIHFAIRVEREFIGVNVGKLDQSCEIYCRENHLLSMDMDNDSMELIAVPDNMPDFSIAIIYSGVDRKLANTAYNLRVDECKAAAYALLAYSGMEYGKFADVTLRDVPKGVFEQYKKLLPENWRKRAQHYYSEVDRVKAGIEAFRRGDIVQFGKYISESGNSSIYQYEAGSEPLKAIHNIMLRTDGIYGGRFSGAGFNGCCMAIVDPSKEDKIRKEITDSYAGLYPEYIDNFSITFCRTGNGLDID